VNRRTYRLWHHWLAIIGGLFLAIFTLTGVVMILPKHVPWAGAPPQVQPMPAVDPAVVAITPAEAVTRTQSLPGGPFRVHRISLAPLGPYMVYTLDTDRGPVRIDATTGEPSVPLSADEAEALIRARFGLAGGALDRSLEERSSWRYWGDAGLPAWVFSEPDQPSVVYAVGAADGVIRARTNSMRVRELFGRSHTLWPVTVLTGSAGLRDITMLATSVLSLLLVATGFFLVLPLPRRRPEGSDKGAA